MVPTVLRIDGFEFYFYSHEGNEPPHIHIDKGDGTAKFWLSPVRLEYSTGLKKQEQRKAKRLVEEHRLLLLESWNERFPG